MSKKSILKSIADYSRVIALKPDFMLNYLYRGLAKYELEDYEGAIADYDRVIEIGSNEWAKTYFFRGNAKSEMSDHEGAEADRKRTIELEAMLKDR